MARVILRTGNGEVAKEVIAVAKNLLPAKLFYRTQTSITNTIHSLADFFNISPSNIFQPTSPKLCKQKAGIYKTLDPYRGNIQKMLN